MAIQIRPLLVTTAVIALISLFCSADALATGWYGKPYASGPKLIKLTDPDVPDNRWRLEYEVKCTRHRCKKTDEAAALISKGIDPFSIETSVVKYHKTYSRTAEVIPQADADDTCNVVGNIDYYVIKSEIDLSPPYTFRIEFTSNETPTLADPAEGPSTFSVQDRWNKCRTFSLQVIEPIAVRTQLSIETIVRYNPDGSIAISLTCEFDPVTQQATCTDTENPDGLAKSYPVENVFATLCANGVQPGVNPFTCNPGGSQTIQLDASKDQCFLGGEGSPTATWYYYRGRWYCSGEACP